jgi:hypothetical protein
MREVRVLSTILIVTALCSSLAHAQKKPTPNPAQNVVALGDVISQVKTALADVQTELASGALPVLKSVKLTLQTVATTKGGAKIKLWVISFGHTWERDKSQEVDIELTPPKPGNAKTISSESLTQELEDAIISAAQGVKDASSGPIPLKLTGLSVQLSFTVKGDTSAGATVEIMPITADFSGDLSKTAVQKLTVTFGTTSGTDGKENADNKDN